MECGQQSSAAFPGWLWDRRRQQTVGDLALMFVLPLGVLPCLPLLIHQLPSDALRQGLLKVASFPSIMVPLLCSWSSLGMLAISIIFCRASYIPTLSCSGPFALSEEKVPGLSPLDTFEPHSGLQDIYLQTH